MASSKDFEIEEFNDWFNDIIFKAELADIRYNIKGFVVFRPWSVFSMSKMFRIYEDFLNETGHQQVMMPTLIPEENFLKESEHVEGFSPEVFWVTKHGDEDFEQKYALRPTSETAFYFMFSYWVQSYKDLPLKTYQRANVFRYDSKATKPFIRGREFYWFEAHNLFETLEEAKEQVLEDMEITEAMLHQEFAIPFLFFKRPQWDKFPGAINTYAADTILPNGKMLQLPSTHLLGTKFTETFNVKFKDKDEQLKFPFGTCYGPAISRIYGGLISVHGDKNGLRLPFDLAPTQVIILPLYFSTADNEKVEKLCLDIAEDLDKLGYRVRIDDQKEKTPKERFSYSEMKGIPLRIEIGPKDILEGVVTVYRRDLNTKEKIFIADLYDDIKKISQEFTDNLREQADEFFESKIVTVYTYDDLKEVLDENKVARVPICSIEMEGKACADEIKADTKGGEVRGTRMDYEDLPNEDAICIVCGKKSNCMAYVSKSY
ncbi:MAG: proline--tRNA ligase [archaeon]|nr:proline--tRNA ligase [archaeon]MDD2477661.1 proline--tRNA ligase [Candidatus ainarchaeum sp.]MDD3084387.1 proline--tRNA ligase [Candidatus ainarchaeum sp.]MDD4220843.1 proline--tRNA ligase [Candidatus ainarchaeum sp.]MDD4662343.1 proline--tRNA ligase [Candidatus ainarchaeum sp.]